MRFMMLILPAGQAQAAPDTRPTLEAISTMMQFNKALQEAGVLLALDGLHPPSSGVRVSTVDGKVKVVDGPFAESKEAIGGYWVLDVASREEAIAWASRCPVGAGDTLEIRQMFDLTDFPADVQHYVLDFHGQAQPAA